MTFHTSMNTHSIYLPPETLNGQSIDAHPENYIIAAGGECDGAGAIVWFIPQFDENEDIVGKTAKTAETINCLRKEPNKIPKYYATEAERLLPLTYISQVKFSPNGTMLAVKGTDGEKDRIFVYEVQFKSRYNEISNSNLKIFIKLELEQEFLSEFAWSPDSCDLAIATELGQLIIYPVMTRIPLCDFENKKLRKGVETKTLKVTNEEIMGITWSSDGKMIIIQTYSELIPVKRKLVKKNWAYTKLETRFPGDEADNKAVEQLASEEENTPDEAENSDVETDSKEYKNMFLKYLPKGREKERHHKRSLRTFYAIAIYKREVAFSPDGNFLVSCAGTFSEQEAISSNRAIAFSSFVFTRKSLYTTMKPCVVLGGYRCPSVAVAFSPVLYELDLERPNLSNLGYKMLFAVASGCDILIYDTEEFKPICIYEGESYQDDYFTSVCFSFTGLQAIAFGSHSQYEFIDLHEHGNVTLKPLKVRSVCSKIEDMICRQANSHLLVKACQKYHKDLEKKEKEQAKESPRENRSITLPKYFLLEKEEPILQPKIPVHSVTDLIYSELPTVQEKIDEVEIDYLCALFDGKEEIIDNIEKKE